LRPAAAHPQWIASIGLTRPGAGCVRAPGRERRVRQRLDDLIEMLNLPVLIDPQDIRLYDGTLAPDYGQLNKAVTNTIRLERTKRGPIPRPCLHG
jgi:hypothetical protein